jgi:hypothetical protein
MGYTNFPNGITSMGVPLPALNDGQTAFSKYYFVNSFNGLDGNSGTSSGSAFQTIGRALDVIEAKNESGAVVFICGIPATTAILPHRGRRLANPLRS